jgi:hypothetical protein
MIDIPPDVALKASIRSGSVYFFRHDAFSSEHGHYFVVLNTNPVTERVILLVWASSEIAKVKARRKNCSSETLIVVKPVQYPTFTFTSIFDCNKVLEMNIERLIQKLKVKELSVMPEISRQIVCQLRNGVLASNLISGRIKTQLK